MFPASTRFFETLSASHEAVIRLDAVRGASTTSFAVIDGTVSLDYDAPIRRSLDCTILDVDGRTSAEMRSLLDPLFTVLHPYRGIRYADGTEEMIPLGEFFVRNVNLADKDGGATFRLQAFDASFRCQGNLPGPYYIQNGTPVHEAIPPLLHRQFGALNFRLPTSPWVTPALLLNEQAQVWDEARKLEAASGYELTIARDGLCTAEPRVITVTGTPAWAFTEGPDADFWDGERVTSSDDHPNIVVVLGSNPAVAGVTGIAADMDPTSRTYRYGAYGQRVKVIRDERVMNNEQATSCAALWLSRLLGPQDELHISAVPNPAIDGGDVITATRERLDLNGDGYIVSRFDIPLTVEGDMPITARRSILTDEQGIPVRQP